MPSCSVRLSGWVSVTFVHCVETSKHSLNLLSPSGRRTILHRVSKNRAFLFLTELRQISTSFSKFWTIDGKVAEIVCCINIFHLTWPTSLHCLFTRRCSKFLPNTGLLQSDCSDLVSKWRGYSVETTFFLGGHCQACAGCLETNIYVSTGRRPSASSTRHCRFPGARQRCVVV